MQQCNVIATTTVHPRQQQEQLRKTTIQTTIQHVAHLPVVHVDATTAAAATCVHLNSDLVTFLIPKEQLRKTTIQLGRVIDHHNPTVTRNQTATTTTTK